MKRWLPVTAAAGLLGFALVSACNNAPTIPGTTIATLNFNAQLDAGASTPGFNYAELPANGGFSFSGVVSAEPSIFSVAPYHVAWFTVDNVSRDGGFDGQRLISVATGTRTFTGCGCTDGVNVYETLELNLFSPDQSAVLSGEGYTDGGCPEDLGPALAATKPTFSSSGSNVKRACGTLTDVFTNASTCVSATPCLEGTLIYGVSGNP